MENGWIRVNSGDVAEVYFRKIWVSHEGISSWLAQANHIFNRLYATCDLQNFICIDTIAYWLTFSASIDDLPPGYLFLCPLADFEFHLPGRLCMPDCPAYWSLDPAGAGHLSPVEARTVGFPDIQLRRAVLGKSWDDCDYAGTRQFHESNGFDAGSQEAAVAMGCPLVEITCDRDVWLAHIKANGACDESSESDVEEYHDFPEAEEDRESTTGSCAADPPKYSGCDDAGMDDESIFSCDEEPGINDVAGTRTADSDAEMFAPSRSWNIIMESKVEICTSTRQVHHAMPSLLTKHQNASDVMKQRGSTFDDPHAGLGLRPPTMDSIPNLRRLASITMDSVTTMEDAYARTGMPLPSLDEPFNPQDPAEALRQDPEVSNAVKNLVAAAAQISATGANAKEIAAPAGVDPGLTARILRLLATHHIFREVFPGVFANNRVSSTLDKGKSSSALFSNRAERLTGSSGIAALVENSADIVGKSAVYLSNSLLNPGKLPFNIAFRTDEAMFACSGIGSNYKDLISSPTGKWGVPDGGYQKQADLVYLLTPQLKPRRNSLQPFGLVASSLVKKRKMRPKTLSPLGHHLVTTEMQPSDNFCTVYVPYTYNVSRLAVAMRGTAATEPQDLIFQGFDWSALPSNGTIVDVGGGIGHLSLTIAQKYPHLRIANQDLAAPIELSKAVSVHDFFEPQPVKDAAAFLMRYTLHDWPDEQVITILSHLRAAATPTTRLVIIIKIVPLASAEDSTESRTNEIPGAARPMAQSPLLPNWGAATADLYLYDLTIKLSIDQTASRFRDCIERSVQDLCRYAKNERRDKFIIVRLVGVKWGSGELRCTLFSVSDGGAVLVFVVMDTPD
ncbi:O-methyltransferase-domain-containing protein [Mycena polygramma]|nr:O-methyltransferase-domain-containing protein [Mycena polygramma]